MIHTARARARARAGDPRHAAPALVRRLPGPVRGGEACVWGRRAEGAGAVGRLGTFAVGAGAARPACAAPAPAPVQQRRAGSAASAGPLLTSVGTCPPAASLTTDVCPPPRASRPCRAVHCHLMQALLRLLDFRISYTPPTSRPCRAVHGLRDATASQPARRRLRHPAPLARLGLGEQGGPRAMVCVSGGGGGEQFENRARKRCRSPSPSRVLHGRPGGGGAAGVQLDGCRLPCFPASVHCL